MSIKTESPVLVGVSDTGRPGEQRPLLIRSEEGQYVQKIAIKLNTLPKTHCRQILDYGKTEYGASKSFLFPFYVTCELSNRIKINAARNRFEMTRMQGKKMEKSCTELAAAIFREEPDLFPNRGRRYSGVLEIIITEVTKLGNSGT